MLSTGEDFLRFRQERRPVMGARPQMSLQVVGTHQSRSRIMIRTALVLAVVVSVLGHPDRALSRLWDLNTATGVTYHHATLDSLSGDSLWITDASSPTLVSVDEIVVLRAVPQPEIGGLWGFIVGAGAVGLKTLIGGFAPHRNEPLVDVGQSIGIVGIGTAIGIIAELGRPEHIDFRLLTVEERRQALRERIDD